MNYAKKVAFLKPNTDEPTVTNNLRKDWNGYIKWLETKGKKGSIDLDKNDMGGKMIDEYRKVNPKTSISRETIKPIQEEFSKYRDWALSEIANKRASFSPNTNKDNFMKSLSIVDGIAGSKTTSFQFPDRYLVSLEDGKVKATENLGFSTKPQTK